MKIYIDIKLGSMIITFSSETIFASIHFTHIVFSFNDCTYSILKKIIVK